MKILGSALGLLVILGFAAGAQAVQHDKGIIEIQDCPSEALKIRLNQGNRSPKEDLIKTIQIFADYNEMKFTPIKGARSEAVFVARIAYPDCGGSCATGAGWTEVQYRLKNIKGARVSCLDGPPPEDGAGGQGQQQQQEQKQEEGGVSGGTITSEDP